MTDEYDVVRGVPDEGPLLDLLHESFDDWGDEAFLRWKYDRPGDERAMGYHVRRDGDLVGFRGMFERTIEGRDGGYDFHVCGDACVAPEHQGEGLYSRIRDATESEIEAQGSDFCSVFTRKGHIPFEVGLDRGWRYRTLPLYIRVLSPANVIPNYARLVLDDDGRIASLLDRFGGRVTLDSGRDRLRLDEILGASTTDPRWSLPVPFPRWATTAAVEVAGSDSLRESAERYLPSARPAPRGDVDLKAESTVDDDLFDAVAALYERVRADYDLAFRRDESDLRHLFDHPHLHSVVTAMDGDELVGVAPVAFVETEDTVEAWVLDVVAVDDGVFDALTAAVEQVADGDGADMVLMMADVDPGRRWARIDKQVLMWTSYGPDTRALETDSLFIGLYDVV